MQLHNIDIVIICACLACTVQIGFWISRRASNDLNSCFHVGKTLPLHVLGISKTLQSGPSPRKLAWALVWRNADKRQDYAAFGDAATVKNFKAFEAGPLTLFM